MIRGKHTHYFYDLLEQMIILEGEGSISAARITFLSHHIYFERCNHEKIDKMKEESVENPSLSRFLNSYLELFAEIFGKPSTDDFKNPIDLYREDYSLNILELARINTPTKSAVEKGLDKSLEWPSDIPYVDWLEDFVKTIFINMFGLYYFNTSIGDMVRWVTKDEHDNPHFINGLNCYETAYNIDNDCGRSEGVDYFDKRNLEKDQIRIKFEHYISQNSNWDTDDLVKNVASKETYKFYYTKEVAYNIFLLAQGFLIILTGKSSRDSYIRSFEDARRLYYRVKKYLMPQKDKKEIVTPEEDNIASEIFYIGLLSGYERGKDLPISEDLLSATLDKLEKEDKEKYLN